MDLLGSPEAIEACAAALFGIRAQERRRWQKKARGHYDEFEYAVWPAWFELSPIQQQTWRDWAIAEWLAPVDRWHREAVRREALYASDALSAAD